MTDISLWQQTLESSGYVVNPDKLATDLYECSLTIFVVLIRHPLAEPGFLQRIRTQLQRFRLWGGDFDAREGGLDERIVNSDRLKDVLLPVLGRMADALVKIAHRCSQDDELEEVIARIRLLNEEALGTNVPTDLGGEDAERNGLQIASILDEITSSGSEVSTIDESREIEELLQDVKSSNDCLFDLGSVLQDSAETIVPSSGLLYGSTAVNLSLLHNTAWPYISNIIEAYPSIDRDFARRLGEANERRYNRLQTKRDEAFTETQGSESDCSGEESIHRSFPVQDSRPSSTGFTQSDSTAPSTKLSSVFDALTLSASDPTRGNAPKTALSVTTFASTLNESEGQKRVRRLPQMPDDQPWGTPFNCTVCGDKLHNVWSSADWVRHIYQDLQPYICTFPACSSEYKAFISRHEWSAHESDNHRKHIAWTCGQCELGAGVFTSEAQLRSHFSKQHLALGPQQVTSVVQSASKLVASGIIRERCPFCLTCPASAPAQLVSHIGRHLQEVAHAAIPMSLLIEDTGSLEDLNYSDDEIHSEGVSKVSSSTAGLQQPPASNGNAELDPKLQITSSVTILQGSEIIVRELLRLGSDPNPQDSKGRTPLHYGCLAKRSVRTIVKTLLEAGADVSALDLENVSSLHLAAEQGHDALVQDLIRSGAVVCCEDSNGRTPLHYGCRSNPPTAAAIKLLIKAGADVNNQDHGGLSPLHDACLSEYVAEDIVRLLLDSGAHTDQPNFGGKLPFHYGIQKGKVQVVKLLLQSGSTVPTADMEE